MNGAVQLAVVAGLAEEFLDDLRDEVRATMPPDQGSAFCSPECEGSYAKLMPLGDAGSDGGDVLVIWRVRRRRPAYGLPTGGVAR
jgi:hypothetical protein